MRTLLVTLSEMYDSERISSFLPGPPPVVLHWLEFLTQRFQENCMVRQACRGRIPDAGAATAAAEDSPVEEDAPDSVTCREAHRENRVDKSD